MEIAKSKRILITTKNETFENYYKTDFYNIDSPFNIGICKTWYQNIISDTDFSNYIKNITLKKAGGREIQLTDPKYLFYSGSKNQEAKIFADRFQEKINNDAEFRQNFLQKVMDSSFCKKKFLRNKDDSIWMVPTINDNYSDDNVNYILNLIAWASEDGAELYLLVHDKDIYNTQNAISNHKVKIEDNEISQLLKKSKALTELIDEGKVFVFTHQGTDTFFQKIVTEKDILKKNADNAIEILKYYNNTRNLFATCGKKMKHKGIVGAIKKNEEECDFSINFLE